MIVTITEYRNTARDAGEQSLSIGGEKIASKRYTAAGAGTAYDARTSFVRVATDTAIHFGTSTDAPFLPANTIDWFAVTGGATPTITASA